jgi:hypothetical protein
MAWTDAMLRDGVKTWVTADRFAAHADGRDHGPVPLVLRRRYARPADLDRLPDGDALVVLGRATVTVLRRLDAAARAWATLDGRYSLPLLGRRRDEPGPYDPIASRRPTGAHDELAVLILALPGSTHAEYAAALGVTRSRVTQMLHDAADRPLPPRPWPTAGHVTRWWSDRDPWDQARAAYEWLDVNGCHPVLGGETAADAVVPWRAPGSSILHGRKIVPPPAGFVPADSHETATVAVVVDYRPSVLAAALPVDTPVGRLRVAHPLHVAADLADAAAVDERAAEHIGVLLRRARSPREPSQEGFGRGIPDHAELGL